MSRVSVVAELDRLAMPYEFAGPEEVTTVCPFHDDHSPSLGINIEKRVFKCRACPASGDFVTLMAKQLNVSRVLVVNDLISRYGAAGEKSISIDTVEKYHNAIGQAGPLLGELYKRGISDESIREYRLGFDSATGRITIPIPDEQGGIVNIRKYLPGAPGVDKMRNLRGRGRIRLFPVAQLKYDKIVVGGGEIKSIATAQRMNKLGYGAVNATGGEDNWDVSFNRRFKDKTVYVCMDVDEVGVAAANKVCAMLKRVAAEVHVVSLPLDQEEYPSGDVNDYFGPCKATGRAFAKLLEESPVWEPSVRERDDTTPPMETNLAESMEAEHVGKRVQVKSMIRALDTTPYLVPHQVRCSCSREEDCCHECPVYAREADANGFTPMTISPESPGILSMMGERKSQQRECIQEALGIPGQCPSCTFLIDQHLAVEDARIAPQINISSRSIDREMVPAAIVGHKLELNSGYIMRGRVHPHPKTQQAYFLVSEFEPSEDALSTYSPSDEDLAELVVFQPKKWTLEALEAKLSMIYSDLAANVTRIYEREDMHRVFDLSFHSPLMMQFDGVDVKGWVEVLIVGDSSQGKSDTAAALMKHYGVGEKVDCKNASIAGLLGGLQQSGNRWFVSWGVIPTHDARLVVLEEAKGLSTELIGKLTDMRSAGIAELPKIEKRKTLARTRLIMLSNPRSGMPMASYNFGVEVVRELLGSAEDVRRFDCACIVAASQIDADTINKLQRHRPAVKHVYTADLCHKLILWAWTRQQVEFEPEAFEFILDEASRMCALYSESIPLVDRGSFRHKLARMSAAVAARTFSTTSPTKDGAILVRRCHVESMSALLDRLYSDPAFGYRDFSRSVADMDHLQDRDVIRRHLFGTPFPKDLVNALLANETVEMRDICDWCGYDRGDAAVMLSLLTRKGALRRPAKERHYRKSADFILLLREMRDSDAMKKVGQPSFKKTTQQSSGQAPGRASVVVPDGDDV